MNSTMNRVSRLMHNTAAAFRRSYTFEEAISANGDRSKQNWIFPPDTLIHGQIEFAVKFLGELPVQQSKGIEVTKEAVQKLRFNLPLKKTQGFKLPKVVLQISINGVNILEAKSKRPLYEHPLHRISFCADDKQDKRVFAYIVKRSAELDDHDCFVFLSNKMAEQITLTVGEAFDLAYRRFLENNGRDLELKKHLIILQKRVQELEEENSGLKAQLARQQRAVSSQENATALINGDSNFTNGSDERTSSKNWESFEEHFNAPVKAPSVPTSPVPPPPIPARPSLLEKPLPPTAAFSDPFVVIDPLKNPLEAMAKACEPLEPTKLEGRLQLGVNYDPEFDPRAEEEVDKLNIFNNLGVGDGNGKPSTQMYDNAIRQIDLSLADMRQGFSQGITFGNDDFSPTDLSKVDTLGNRT